MIEQLDTVTKTLSQHLDTAEKLSKALSNKQSGDTTKLNEMTTQVRELAKQVSRLSERADSHRQGFLRYGVVARDVQHVTYTTSPFIPIIRAVLDAVHKATKATADAVQHAAAAVQHHVGPHAANAVHHVQHAASIAVHHAGNAIAVVKHHGSHAAAAARDGAVVAVGTVQHVVSHVAEAVGHAVGDASGVVRHHVGNAAAKVGEKVGPVAHATGHQIQRAGGAVHSHALRLRDATAERVQPVKDAMDNWWESLSEQHKGMVKVAVLLVGVQVLLRGGGGSGKKSVQDGKAHGDAVDAEDIGKILRQLQRAVTARVQRALPAGKTVADNAGNNTATTKVAAGTTAEVKTEGSPLTGIQQGAQGALASLQCTGAAALGALQHAAEEAVGAVKGVVDRPKKEKPYLG